jgi:ubiquinone biosynthesis protein
VSDRVTRLLELAILVPGLVIVSAVAIRLLGVRRSWTANLVSVGIAAVVGVVGSWVLAGRDLDHPGFVRDSLALTFLLTMVAAVGADLLARPGSLAHGEAAGLFVVPRPANYVRVRLDSFRRTREIVEIARANGFGHLLGRRRRDADEEREPVAVRARRSLEQMGGMFVKLGQVASTRTDLLPPDVIAELSKLQDKVPPEPHEAMQALIESELGCPVDVVFAELDWTPVAAASIGQVYFATLRTGEAVVVKAQRPEVAETVERDLAILLRLCGRLQESTPQGRQYRVLDLATEFADGLRAELDFQIEGRSTTEIGRNMADEPGVRAPHIYDEYSTTRLLVQERFDGVSVRDSEAIAGLGFDNVDLADRLLRAALRQILTDGFFHADLHPGNVFVLRNGDIGMIDFGATGRLDPLTQASLRQMLLAVNLRDAAMLRQAVDEVCTIGPEVDLDALERALSRFMSIHISPGSSVDAAALHDLLALLGRFGIQVPADLTTFSRALVILEGTLGTLAPGFSLPDHAQQVASEWAADRFSAEALDELARNEVLGMLPILRQLPRHADRIATQIERGELLGRVSLFSTAEDRSFITKMVNRAVLGFLGAALGGISVVLLSLSQDTFVTSQEFFEVFGYVGLLGSVVLILRVVASVVREGLS